METTSASSEGPQMPGTGPSSVSTMTPAASTSGVGNGNSGSSSSAATAADSGSSQLKYLVIDSGAIIRGEGYSFPRMAEKLVTIQEVISEIRDSKSREK